MARFTQTVSLAVLILLATPSIALPTENLLRPSRGDVILVGGGLADSNKEVWDRIIEAGGGSQSKFGVLTAGSIPESEDPNAGTPDCDNSKCNGAYYANLLRKYGAGSAEWIPVDLDHQDTAEDSQLAELVRGYTGFFIGGGDQSRYIDTLVNGGDTDTVVLAAIREAIENGAGVAGTSAGSAIQQAGPMVTGGESYYGARDGSFPRLSDNLDKLTYRPGGGFGFFDIGLVDTHFGVRGRHGRLIRLLSDTGNSLGFGVDEDTALVSSGGNFTVLGTNNVHMIDLSEAESTEEPWSIKGVQWSLLASGDTVETMSGKVVPVSSPGSDRRGTMRVPLATTDIFSSPENQDRHGERKNPYEIVKVAENMIRNGSDTSLSETFETSPIFQVRLAKGSAFKTWQAKSRMPSFSGMTVDISRSPASG